MLKKLGIFVMVIALLSSFFVFSASAETGKVIYIKDGGDGDGSSPEEAMGVGDSGDAWADAPLYQAWEELKETGGTIVICGPYTLKSSDARRTVGAPDIIMDSWYRNPDVTITYTSVYGGVDYRKTANAKLIFDDNNTSITFPTATVLENITVVAGATTDRDNYLCAAYQSLTLKNGTNFVANANGKLPVILGGHRNYSGIAAVDADAKITVDIGNSNTIGTIYGNLAYSNKDQYGSVYITIKSGKVSGVYGDNQNNHGYGVTGSINLDIQGGIFSGEIAISNNGYAASSERKATLKISGGDFSACTGIKDKSDFFVANSPDRPAPENVVVDCSAASWKVYDQVVAHTSLTVTEPTAAKGDDSPNTGDIIGISLALLAVSGLGITLLKKKEF